MNSNKASREKLIKTLVDTMVAPDPLRLQKPKFLQVALKIL